MSGSANIWISEIPHYERLCLISFAADSAPAPRHCVITTARFLNICGAGRCGILTEIFSLQKCNSHTPYKKQDSP